MTFQPLASRILAVAGSGPEAVPVTGNYFVHGRQKRGSGDKQWQGMPHSKPMTLKRVRDYLSTGRAVATCWRVTVIAI